MIFLSKPSVYFLPGTWEAQEAVTNTLPAMMVITPIILGIATIATISVRKRKRV